MARTNCWSSVHFDLDLENMTILGQGHNTSFGHGQQLCEILFKSNMVVRSYGPEKKFGYVYTVTLTRRYGLGSMSSQTLGSWTKVV